MTMRRRSFTVGVGSALLAAPALTPSLAQGAWPSKQIKVIVPYPPGGPSDVSARIVVDRAAQILGQTALFDNKAGASGMIGAEFVKNAPVDNHTFLLTTTAMVTITRHLQPIPFDPEKDFVPVSRMTTSWGAMAINPAVPARNMAEFVAYTKANPGKVNFGSSGMATITHLFGEMLMHEAGIKMTHVPYRGSAPALQATLANEVQVQFDQLTLPHIKAGKLRGMAMLSEVRHPEFPDLPTLREVGYGKDGGDSWFGILAPTGTSADAIDKLDKAIAQALKQPDVMEKVHNGGMRVTYLNPADFKARIASENETFGNIIRQANIKI
jgi:tripartite-type tricarboxylate transporter receptor subunit TctC